MLSVILSDRNRRTFRFKTGRHPERARFLPARGGISMQHFPCSAQQPAMREQPLPRFVILSERESKDTLLFALTHDSDNSLQSHVVSAKLLPL